MSGKARISPLLELAAVLSLLLLVAALRLYHLEADPPQNLSISSGVDTDPSQYTVYAKNYVQEGEFDPYHDARRAVFLKSAVNGLAVVVFSVLGTGLWESNLVGFLYGLGALVLFWLFMRKTGGQLAGLLFLFLIAFNYNLIFYGKLPFLEHALAFFAFLAVVLLLHGRSLWVCALAGASLAAGIFFGKAIGLILLFPFACFLAYRWLYALPDERKQRLGQSLLFAAGFVVVLGVWYFVTYAPAQSQVSGYYGEQAVSLYGAPEGLQSVNEFFRKLLTFGVDSRLFERMVTAGLLGATFVGMFVFHISRPQSWREALGPFDAGRVFVATMIIALFGALMIWNYRPLRYQTLLIYPFYGAAALMLSRWWHGRLPDAPARTPYLFYLLGTLVAMVPVYQVWDGLADRYGWDFYYSTYKYWSALLAFLLIVAVGLSIRFRLWRRIPAVGTTMRVIVILVLAVNVVTGIVAYAAWLKHPTFTARDNSRDVGLVLSDAAVLSGPYAPLFAMENDLDVVIHMFGVAEADPALFDHFPITHLLLDEPNEKMARADYPDIMEKAEHIVTYHLRTDKVRLLRVAGATGNERAARYVPSIAERALGAYRDDRVGEGHALTARFLERNPNNMTAFVAAGEVAAVNGQDELAEESFKKAIEFSPTNYHLNSRLAQFYKDRYTATADEQYKREALVYFEEAIRLAPNAYKLKSAYNELKVKNAWQLKEDTTSSSQP